MLLIEEHNQKRLLDEIELPLARVLASMEKEGFLVDAEGIETYRKRVEEAVLAITCDPE